MRQLAMLALFLIAAIVLVWLAIVLLGAVGLGEPWRTVILALLVLGILFALARQFGGSW